MENSMTAIISLTMITLGFVNGFVYGMIYEIPDKVKLQKKLQEAIDLKLESDKKVDELNDRIRELEYKTSQIRKILMPPPSEELERQTQYIDSDDEVCSPIKPNTPI